MGLSDEPGTSVLGGCCQRCKISDRVLSIMFRLFELDAISGEQDVSIPWQAS